MFLRALSFVSPRGEGCSWEFLVGVHRPVLQILTLFQTKNVIFQTSFQTERKQKKSLDIHLELAYFSFLDSSFSFGFETINTFIHSLIACVASVKDRAKNGEVNGNACDAG